MKLHDIPLGFKMWLDADESQDMMRRKEGTYESWLLDIITERMDPNGIFIDVGGNKGYHSLFVKSQFPESTVLCYEPENDNGHWLARSISANGFDIQLRRVALSDTPGRQVLYLGEYSGLHSLTKWRRSTDKVQMTDCVTLDYEMAYFDKISFIKLDTEGGEYNILKGGRETLKKTDTIVLEYEQSLLALQGLTRHDLIDFLQDYFPHITTLGDKRRGHIICNR